MYISYSGHKLYKQCPKQYWHRYVNKTVPEQPDNRVNAMFGSVVGTLFEVFYAEHLWKLKGIEEILRARAEPMLDQLIAREAQGGTVNFKDKASNYKSRAALLLDILDAIPRGLAIIRHHRLLGMDAQAEVKLDTWIEGHQIGGRADFIMTRIKPHGDRIILDGKGSRHREKYVDPSQLKWYAMLYRIKEGRMPDGLGFVFWRQEPDMSLDWVPFTSGDLDELRAKVIDDCNGIERAKGRFEGVPKERHLALLPETFAAKPSGDCKLCPYLSQCSQGQAYTTAVLPPDFYDASLDDVGV